MEIIPIAFNLYMLWVDVSPYTWKVMTKGTWYSWDNPFPEIVWDLCIQSLVFSFIFQFSIIFVIKLFRTKIQQIARIFIAIVIIVLNSLLIRAVSYGMSSIWMEALYETDIWNKFNYFAEKQSWLLVLPTSAIIMMIAIYVRLIETGNIKKVYDES